MMTRRITSLIPGLLGLSLLIGGERRFLVGSFSIAHELAPWWVWGVLFCIPGVWMMLYAWRLVSTVFWPAFFAAVLFGFWTGTIMVASQKVGAPYTGVAVYGWVTLCMAAIAARDSDRIVVQIRNRFTRKTNE